MMMEPPLDYYSYRDRRPSPDPPKLARRKSKSFHFEDVVANGSSRRADANNRRGSMDNPRRPKLTSLQEDDGGSFTRQRPDRTNESFDRRKRRDKEYFDRGASLERRERRNANANSNYSNSSPGREDHKRSYNANLDCSDRGASLERRNRDDYSYSRREEYWNSQEQLQQQQQQQQQQKRQPKTVIHACDDKTGKCLFHPHIVLRKKAIFGVLGGWVDVLRSCPECEEEDLRRLNSVNGAFVDAAAGLQGSRGSAATRDRQQSQPQPTGMARRPRRRTLSPLNDKRDRTLSPQDRNNSRRDYGESRNNNIPSSQLQQHQSLQQRGRRDRTLSPIERTKRGMETAVPPPPQQYQQQQSSMPQNYRGTKQPILPKRGVPRPRSRTLSPIDQSRRRLGAFGKGKSQKGNNGYDSVSNHSSASYSEEQEEEQGQKRRQPSNRGRNGSWKSKLGNSNNNSKMDRKGCDYDDDNNYDDGGRSKKEKRKKNRLRVKQRESDNNHTEDYISSYIVSGAVPGADTHRSTKNSKRQSLGGLNTSGNSSVGDWNLSDYAEKGKKLAEKVMRKGKKKAKDGKKRSAWEDTVAADCLSVDERLEILFSDYVGHDYEKSPPYSPKQKIKQQPVDSSVRTKNASYDNIYTGDKHTTQFSRRKMEQPQQKDAPALDEKYSNYQKSWSADGLRVHASVDNNNKDGDIEDHYAKALSLDGGIRVMARDDPELESSDFAWRQKEKYERSVNDSVEVNDRHGRNSSHSSYNQEDSSKASFDHNQEKPTQFDQQEVDPSYDIEWRSQTEPPPPSPKTLEVPKTNKCLHNPLSISSEKFNSQDMKASVRSIDKLLESIMHENIDHQSTVPSGPSGEGSSDDDSSEDSLSHHDSEVPHPEDRKSKNDTSAEEDVPLSETNDTKELQTELDPEERPDQPQTKRPSLFPFPSKQECLPRVRSIGNLTIDLTALQATRPSKVESKPVDVKPAVTVTENVAPGASSDSDSEESIKIDRAALQRPRRKDKTSDEKVKTFDTSNLPWTGRFGESGMYTGLVNEQYQPHGKGTMIFDTGDVKKGHWKNGDFVRECGAFSDSENDDDDDDVGEGDLSSSMMDLNLSLSSKYGRDRSRSRSKDCVDTPLPTPLPSYQIGEVAKHRDMIHESAEIEELVPKLKVDDGAFIRRSDGKWTYAVVKILETNGGKRAIRFTVNERNSSKSYVEKYWFTHIRPMKLVEQQLPPSDTTSVGEREGRPKQRDPAGMISRQSSMTSLTSTTSEKEEEPANRGISCPPTQNRLFGGRSRSRSRRRAVSFSPMRTLCSISESDMEDEDSDEDNDDSFNGNSKLEVTGLHNMARSRYTLRGIDP